MIYFDNAATSFPKPPDTEKAIVRALRTLGNAGRGAHAASLAAGRTVYSVRQQLAELFHAEDSSRIAFAQNTTQALNTAIFGTLQCGDHVITTACEHNSVLRPLYLLEKEGVDLTIVPADRKGRIDYTQMEQSVRANTKAIIVTHASNLTGNVTDLERVSRLARERGLLLIVDAAQTAGILPLDVQRLSIDILCFPGHKGLMGPQGTGGIYVRPGVTVRPLMVGGSGVHSYDREHPADMPTALEAGTLNTHGIAGLGGGLEFLKKTGREAVRQREDRLARRFYDGVKEVPGVTLYGDFSAYEQEDSSLYKKEGSSAYEQEDSSAYEQRDFSAYKQGDSSPAIGRVATIALNIGDLDSADTAEQLSECYGIEVRAGAHCAPLMHRAFGTADRGAVRFSFSYFNTEEEIDEGIRAVREIAEDS